MAFQFVMESFYFWMLLLFLRRLLLYRSIQHEYLLTDRITDIHILRHYKPNQCLSGLHKLRCKAQGGQRRHPQVLRIPKLLRVIRIYIMWQFPGEDHQGALPHKNLPEIIHQIFIFPDTRVLLILLAPTFDPILKPKCTLEASACLICIAQGEDACQFCITDEGLVVSLAQKQSHCVWVVIVFCVPGLGEACPEPRIDVEVVDVVGLPVWVQLAWKHQGASVEAADQGLGQGFSEIGLVASLEAFIDYRVLSVLPYLWLLKYIIADKSISLLKTSKLSPGLRVIPINFFVPHLLIVLCRTVPKIIYSLINLFLFQDIPEDQNSILMIKIVKLFRIGRVHIEAAHKALTIELQLWCLIDLMRLH